MAEDVNGVNSTEAKPSNTEFEVDEEGVAESDDSTTWHDVALSIAAELMLRIREEIRAKLGYTTSAVGVLVI